jgi:hypothetical protein
MKIYNWPSPTCNGHIGEEDNVRKMEDLWAASEGI